MRALPYRVLRLPMAMGSNVDWGRRMVLRLRLRSRNEDRHRDRRNGFHAATVARWQYSTATRARGRQAHLSIGL